MNNAFYNFENYCAITVNLLVARYNYNQFAPIPGAVVPHQNTHREREREGKRKERKTKTSHTQEAGSGYLWRVTPRLMLSLPEQSTSSVTGQN
ncbi:unnamed protein product [Coffea canephora]|uniref:Uncharacterized protein n=1 Tax=Coffea canephora TaxID=49390 RepID=A0A068U0Y9_COFCA|nr:unnamed protein product [Coffea canephora]